MGTVKSRPKDTELEKKDDQKNTRNSKDEKKSGVFSWFSDKEEDKKQKGIERKAEEKKMKEKQRKQEVDARKKEKTGFFSWAQSSDDEYTDQEDETDNLPQKKFKQRIGITFYGAQLSPNSRKVKLVLKYKRLKYREVTLDLLKGEQSCPEFLKINPSGKVPVVVFKNVKDVPDCTVTDSSVIMEFLDRVLPGTDPLMIGVDNDILQCKMWQDWEAALNTNMLHMIKINVLPFVLRMKFKSREELLNSLSENPNQRQIDAYLALFQGKYMPLLRDREDNASICYRNLFKVEHALEGKSFLVNDRFSMADLSIYPRLEMFAWIGLPIKKSVFPNVTNYMKRMSKMDCVTASETSPERFFRRAFTYAEWFVEAFGNWKTGNKLERFDGSQVLPRIVSEDNQGDILEPAPIPDVPERATVVYSYPIAAETWQVKIALKELRLQYREERCDWLDLIGRPLGTGTIFRIQRGDQIHAGARNIMEAANSFGWLSKLLPADAAVRADCQQWQAWEQNLYNIYLYPMVEKTIFTNLLVKRFGSHKLDNFITVRGDPDYRHYFRHFALLLYFGFPPGGVERDNLGQMYPHLETLQEETITLDHYEDLQNQLQYLENYLKGKNYLVNSRRSMADICVFCRLLLVPYVGMKLSSINFPNITRWMDLLEEEESFSEVATSVRSRLDRILDIDDGETSFRSSVSIPESPVVTEIPRSPETNAENMEGTREQDAESITDDEVQKAGVSAGAGLYIRPGEDISNQLQHYVDSRHKNDSMSFDSDSAVDMTEEAYRQPEK